MAAPQQYGAESENLLIGILSFIIVLSIALVIWLNVAMSKPCTEHEYVYCGNQSEAAADHH